MSYKHDVVYDAMFMMSCMMLCAYDIICLVRDIINSSLIQPCSNAAPGLLKCSLWPVQMWPLACSNATLLNQMQSLSVRPGIKIGLQWFITP